VFKDSISFANYYIWLIDNQDNIGKVNEINKSLGFVCMHEIYDKGLDALCESESMTCSYIEEHARVFHIEKIDSTVFHDMQAPDIVGYIANEQGLYQVGDKIYRSTYDYCYCIINGDESKIQTLLNLKDDNTGDALITSNPTFFYKNTRGQYAYRTAYFDDKHRAVGRLSTGYVSQTGVTFHEFETDSQRKSLGIWGGYKLDGAWVSWGNGYFTYEYANGTLHTETISSGRVGGTNRQKISRTFSSELYSTIIPSSSNVNTVHTVKYNNDSVKVYYSNAFTGN